MLITPRARLLLASLVLALLGLAAIAAADGAPPGPRLAVNVFHVYPNPGTEVKTMGPAGEAQLRAVGGPDSDLGPGLGSTPIWSPDGRVIAFTAGAGGRLGIYLVGADGSNPHLLESSIHLAPRVFFQEQPVFSPGGDLVISALKLIRGHFERPWARDRDDGPPVIAAAVWAIPVDGRRPHPLTPWQRKRLIVPSSFAPEGTLVATVTSRRGTAVARVNLDSGETTTITGDGWEPVVSPDGLQIAFLRHKFGRKTALEESRIARTDLFVIPFTGGKPTLVTRVKGGARWPSWDPSGQRLVLTALGGGDRFQASEPHQGNSLIEVNADGSCLTRVFSTERGFIYGAAWQPGPGHEAGPISC